MIRSRIFPPVSSMQQVWYNEDLSSGFASVSRISLYCFHYVRKNPSCRHLLYVPRNIPGDASMADLRAMLVIPSVSVATKFPILTHINFSWSARTALCVNSPGDVDACTELLIVAFFSCWLWLVLVVFSCVVLSLPHTFFSSCQLLLSFCSDTLLPNSRNTQT